MLAVVEAFGDSTVQLRFHAWMDQERHDILKLKSAAIAALKRAYDEEGVEMPEPIYRVQTRPAPEPGAARTKKKQYHVAMDVSADAELDEQVDYERRSGGEDLLSDHAPLE